MRRNGTEIMAIGAILAGAAIGATGTLAITGNPLESRATVGLNCEYLYVPGTRMHVTWIYTVVDGELRRKKCPRRIRTAFFAQEAPVRTIDRAHQAELAALARELAEARSRFEVIQALEGRKMEAGTAAAKAAEAVAARAAETARAAEAAAARAAETAAAKAAGTR